MNDYLAVGAVIVAIVSVVRSFWLQTQIKLMQHNLDHDTENRKMLSELIKTRRETCAWHEKTIVRLNAENAVYRVRMENAGLDTNID